MTTIETSKTSRTSKTAIDAVRHLVYFEMSAYFSAATLEQVRTVAGNLGIRSRWSRLLGLKVTPDVARHACLSQREIEWQLFRRSRSIGDPQPYQFGDEHLAMVPGIFRRSDESPWRLNMPENSALFFYGERYDAAGWWPTHISGVLVIPLNRPRTFYPLSSSKYGGPKAARLSSEDHLFFTQFEEVSA